MRPRHLVMASVIVGACRSYGTDDAPPADGGVPDSGVAPDGSSDVTPEGDGGSGCTADCPAVEIGSITTSELVYALAVDATHVYWMSAEPSQDGDSLGNNGHLYACPKTGCPTSGPISLVGDGQTPGTLAGNGTRAYASFVFGFRKLLALKSGTTEMLPVTAPLAVSRFAVGESNLHYLALYTGVDSGSPFNSETLLWNGSAQTSIGTYAGTANVTDFTVVGNQQFLGSYASLFACDVPCTSAWGTLSTSITGLASLTTDGTSLFLRIREQHQVVRSPTTAFAPTELIGPGALGNADPLDVYATKGAVYVSTTNGDLFSCSPTSCPPKPLVHDANLGAMPSANFGTTIGVDDQAVYYVGLTSGSTWHIMRVAK